MKMFIITDIEQLTISCYDFKYFSPLEKQKIIMSFLVQTFSVCLSLMFSSDKEITMQNNEHKNLHKTENQIKLVHQKNKNINSEFYLINNININNRSIHERHFKIIYQSQTIFLLSLTMVSYFV